MKYSYINPNYIKYGLNIKFNYYYDLSVLNIDRFDIYHYEIINQEIYNSCLNKKIGFNLERKKIDISSISKKINKIKLNPIDEANLVLEMNKYLKEKNLTSYKLEKKVQKQKQIKVIQFPIVSNDTMNQTNDISIAYGVKNIKNEENNSITNKNKTTNSDYHKMKTPKNTNETQKQCYAANQTSITDDKIIKLKDYIITEISKNKSIMLLENGKVEKIFYKNDSYMVINNTFPKIFKEDKNIILNNTTLNDLKINLNLIDKHYINSDNKTFEKITKKVIVIDPKNNKQIFNNKIINITIKINDFVNKNISDIDEKLDFETLLKKKYNEFNKFKISDKKDAEFYEELMNMIKSKLNYYLKNKTSTHKNALYNITKNEIQKNNNYLKPVSNFTNLKIKVNTNKNSQFIFNTTIDNTKKFSEILLKINITEPPQKTKIIIINKTINVSSEKQISIQQEGNIIIIFIVSFVK